MKFITISILTLSLIVPVYCQQEPAQSAPETKLGQPVTRNQLLKLLQAQKEPRIPFRRALSIAERKIDLPKAGVQACHLFEGRLVVAEDPNQEPSWEFWWFCRNFYRGSRYVGIKVSMQGKAQFVKEN